MDNLIGFVYIAWVHHQRPVAERWGLREQEQCTNYLVDLQNTYLIAPVCPRIATVRHRTAPRAASSTRGEGLQVVARDDASIYFSERLYKHFCVAKID